MAPARRLGALQIHEETTEHRHSRQQIRAPDDVSHRFGQHRMHGPQARHEQRNPKAAKQPEHQRKHEKYIAGVQQKIDPVIPRRLAAVSKTA